MADESKLNKKRQAFVKEYIVDLNATQAAIRAGYSKNRAREIGYQLLRDERVQEEIQKEVAKRFEKAEINADRVLNQLVKQAFADMKDMVTWEEKTMVTDVQEEDGVKVITRTIYPSVRLKEMDEVDGTLITEIQETKDGIKFKRADPQKALELLGKYLELFTDKKSIHLTGNLNLSEMSTEQLKELARKMLDE